MPGYIFVYSYVPLYEIFAHSTVQMNYCSLFSVFIVYVDRQLQWPVEIVHAY